MLAYSAIRLLYIYILANKLCNRRTHPPTTSTKNSPLKTKKKSFIQSSAIKIYFGKSKMSRVRPANNPGKLLAFGKMKI